MATYKVIQDIEAEDKFVGPLTLKQFIFAMGGGLFGYLSFFAITRGFFWALALTLPPTLLGFFMAIPWSKDQSTDVWVLAKLRFRLKPKKRVWDQDGVMDLVTITAPKKVERPLIKNMSQTEVKSRLKALADTIDSRGWVIKHAQYPSQADSPADDGSADRLISVDTLPQEVPDNYQVVPDILEGKPKLDSMLEKSGKERKERIYEKMDQIRQGQPPQDADTAAPFVSPPPENLLDEQALSASLKAIHDSSNIGTGNMRSLPSDTVPDITNTTLGSEEPPVQAKSTEVNKAQATMTEQIGPDILELSRDDNLKVSTIAERADDKDSKQEPEEVVISLH